MVLVELHWLEDAELIRRIGRRALAAILERLAPVLAQQGLALPDPGLPDAIYFPKLAAVLRALSLKLEVCLAPFPPGNSRAPAETTVAAGGRPLPACSPARYALHRDGPLWRLILRGRLAILKHEQGLCYVAEMLSLPGEPVSKLSLAAKYSMPRSRRSGGIEVYDPATGLCEPPASVDAVHQSSLAGDDLEARRVCQAKARELRQRIRDPAQTKAAVADARTQLQEITAFLARDGRSHRNSTKAAGDAVRTAIKRLLRTLLAGKDSAASPEPVRRAFARYLQRYLFVPSSRFTSPKARQAGGELTGCLLYEPPPGVVWVVSQSA